MIRAAVLSALFVLPTVAAAVTCENVKFDAASFTICEVDAAKEDLRLFLRNSEGLPLGQFQKIEQTLPDGMTLSFAMNAGMYHLDRSPVGLYVEEYETEKDIVTSAGPGNFGLLPNGVFCIQDGQANVVETIAFKTAAPECRFASQSGPMLVIEGALHPRFIPGGSSRHIRNGVGTTGDGSRAVFAISNEPVNFDTFGRLFRDELNLPNALYFDGKVSRLHAPAIGRSDPGFWMGPIVGVIERK